MRILYVVPGLTCVDRLCFQPFVEAQIDSLIQKGIDAEILNLKGYENKINYIKAIFFLRKLLKTEDFDLIHAHYSYCGWVAVFQKKLPVIVSFMGSDLFGAPNIRWYHVLRGYFDVIISKKLQHCVQKIIVKSDDMKRKLLHDEKAVVIPNGVDFNLFHPTDKKTAMEELKLAEDFYYILFLGNPQSRVKNITLAQEAMHTLSNLGYHKVKLLNPFCIGQDKVVKYMNACDVLLLTSYREGSPNVVKEAMACNLPIVTTDVGDIKKIIKLTKGCYITSFDPEDVAYKLEKVLKNGTRTDGREHIRYLEIGEIAKRILNIYKEVINAGY